MVKHDESWKIAVDYFQRIGKRHALLQDNSLIRDGPSKIIHASKMFNRGFALRIYVNGVSDRSRYSIPHHYQNNVLKTSQD